MDKTFFQGLLERTAIVVTIIGVTVLLVGAGGGLRLSSFSIELFDVVGRAVVIIAGSLITVCGIFLAWQDTKGKKRRARQRVIEAVPLLGRKEVYREARRLIKRCRVDEVIRATSFGPYMEEAVDSSDEESVEFNSYLEALAIKVREAKDKRLDMVYKVVMGFGYDSNGVPPPYKQSGIRNRRKTFGKYDALDRLQIRSIDTTWSIDVLIVGDADMIIGFPTVTGKREITLGIRLTGRDFVRKAIRWFDDFVWQSARPVTWTGEEE